MTTISGKAVKGHFNVHWTDVFCAMFKENKPIKRSSQLATLSREHHEGLLFCWKIRQGLENGTDIMLLRDFTLWYWRYHMKPHFYQEEKILLPYISGHSFADQLKKEHDDIRELILSLDKDPNESLFSTLAILVSNHIRFEERQVFNYLENVLSEDQLNVIAKELAITPASGEEWEQPFWGKRIKD